MVSLQDVLEENQQLEETANAVLGPSDDSSCTYPKASCSRSSHVLRSLFLSAHTNTHTQGYVDRQAIYACATCSKAAPFPSSEGGEEEKLAGVCLACSLHCHEDHDLYELYTKRSSNQEHKKCSTFHPPPPPPPPLPLSLSLSTGSSGVIVATPSSPPLLPAPCARRRLHSTPTTDTTTTSEVSTAPAADPTLTLRMRWGDSS